MKKTFKALLRRTVVIALAAIIGFGMAGCEQLTDGDEQTGNTAQTANPSNPAVSDFTITGLSAVYDGSPKTVSITPKEGKSQVDITVWYEGISPTVYDKSTTAPSEAGSYAVTFDVTAAEGFNVVTGLSAGTLVITGSTNPAPVDPIPVDPITPDPITDPHKIIDFEEGWDATGYTQRTVAWGGYAWTVSGVVTTTDDRDHFDGAKSIRLRGNEGDNCRVELDSYINGIKSIYFDYASYGTHSDGTIALYSQTKGGQWEKAGEVTAPVWEGAMLKAKFELNKTNVRFKIVREGDLANFTSVNVDNIIITADSEDSFNVIAVDPAASDFTVSGLSAIYDGSAKAVSITPKAGKSQGDLTVWYEGISPTVYDKSATAPSEAGSYAVTFDVAAAEGFNAVTGLSAGTLEITEITDSHIIVDFEDSEWAGIPYQGKTINWGGYEWRAYGFSTMTAGSDRMEGERSIRFRGNMTADINDNTNRVELMDYLTTGIKSISFDYASFSSHSNGTIILSYQEEDGNWVEAGRIDAVPSWSNAGEKFINAKYDINVTGNVRFKIEKLSASGSTSVNVDNIVITY